MQSDAQNTGNEQEKMIFIDGCISTHESRTKQLCKVYIDGVRNTHPNIKLETLHLDQLDICPLTPERIKERDSYVYKKDWQQPMFDLARKVKEADYIVLGTPYWDLSFASIVKVFIENIMVADLTFEATDTGFIGLCKGKLLTYITTAGGFIGKHNYGYDYMQGIADMIGIEKTRCIMAEGLDIQGMDAETILQSKVEEIQIEHGEL